MKKTSYVIFGTSFWRPRFCRQSPNKEWEIWQRCTLCFRKPTRSPNTCWNARGQLFGATCSRIKKLGWFLQNFTELFARVSFVDLVLRYALRLHLPGASNSWKSLGNIGACWDFVEISYVLIKTPKSPKSPKKLMILVDTGMGVVCALGRLHFPQLHSSISVVAVRWVWAWTCLTDSWIEWANNGTFERYQKISYISNI